MSNWAMGHSHSHSHGHSHSHAHAGSLGRLKLAFFLNFSFAIIELIGGLYTNSVAVLSDAIHDLGDSLALALALGLEKVSHKNSDNKYSYGYRRFSTLGALITGLVLVFGAAFILSEAIPRLVHPEQPKTNEMIFLAFLGLAVNGYAALRVSKGASLNEKMIMWHLLEDVMGWALVLVGAIAMKIWNLPQIDAAMAVALSLWVLYNVFRNLRETLKVFLQATPGNVSVDEIQTKIRVLNLVQDVHHSHFWSLDGEKHIFTTHVVLAEQASHEQMDVIKKQVKELLRDYQIVEATIEIEFPTSQCEDPTHK